MNYKKKNYILILIVILLLYPYLCLAKNGQRRMNRYRINIGAYYLKKYARTEDHIRDIHNCGIDFIVGIDNDINTLDLFHKYKIGAIVTGVLPSWGGIDGRYAGQLKRYNPINTYKSGIRKFKNHKAIWGIDIGDEPSALDFSYYNEVFRLVKDSCPNQFPYLNLYPNYASVARNTSAQTQNQLGTASYKDYIKQYCENITSADYICYDFYVYSIAVPNMYNNLIIVSDAALKYKKSMWVVLQVNSAKKDIWITENQLRFQAYSAMAFGAENIIWGCYTGGWWYNNVLDSVGNKTQQYDKLKIVNKEIHKLSIPYMKYQRENTSFVDFKGSNWIKGTPVTSIDSYNDDDVKDLETSDNSPLLVESMKSRKQKNKQALFIFAADDPYDKNPQNRIVSFKSKHKVLVTTGNTNYKLRPNEDGIINIRLSSNNCAFVEFI